MIYSVWHHGRREYDYFQTPELSEAVNAPTPSHLNGGMTGAAPEKAAWPLPSNAKPVGSGKYPRGYIASSGHHGALGLIPDLTPTNLVLMGTLGYIAYRYWKNR